MTDDKQDIGDRLAVIDAVLKDMLGNLPTTHLKVWLCTSVVHVTVTRLLAALGYEADDEMMSDAIMKCINTVTPKPWERN